jgi:hypothetical protein
MFRRYAIVDERDLRDAVELLAKGTRGGQLERKPRRLPPGEVAKIFSSQFCHVSGGVAQLVEQGTFNP